MIWHQKKKKEEKARGKWFGRFLLYQEGKTLKGTLLDNYPDGSTSFPPYFPLSGDPGNDGPSSSSVGKSGKSHINYAKGGGWKEEENFPLAGGLKLLLWLL